MSINDLGLHREPIHRNRTTILTNALGPALPGHGTRLPEHR